MTTTQDQKVSARFAGVIAAVFGMSAVLPAGAILVALSCVAAAVASHVTALAAIFVLFILRIGNPALIQGPNGLATLAWAVLIVAALRIWIEALRRGVSLKRTLPPYFIPYVLLLVILSALFSTLPSVSLPKAISFGIMTSALCLGFQLMRQDARPASSFVRGLWLAILVLSLPTVAISSIGFLRDGQGFQGVLNHPQGFAVFLAPIVPWLGIKAFSAEGNGRLIPVGLFVLSFASLWLTRGRTGVIAIVLAALVLMILRPGFWKSLTAIGLRALSHGWVVMGLVLLMPLLLWKAPELWGALQEFLFKGSGTEGLAEAANASRGTLIDQQIYNFQSSPIFGIGFGVSNSDTSVLNVVIDPITGLPIGAATEKANLPLAVLEETGVLGALLFVPFLFVLARRLARTRSLALAWAALAALSTNISEMTFFSMGGMGLYTWIIFAWALSETQSRSMVPVSRPARMVARVLSSAS